MVIPATLTNIMFILKNGSDLMKLRTVYLKNRIYN
jgi:hypothetical protein